jgi:hypothetical protein
MEQQRVAGDGIGYRGDRALRWSRPPEAGGDEIAVAGSHANLSGTSLNRVAGGPVLDLDESWPN